MLTVMQPCGRVAAGISAAFHRRAQRFPGLQYLRAAAGEQANEKFLAAEPNGDTFAPLHKLPDDRRNTLQTFITCKMAVCIVELLEKIDVHHHGGDGRHFVPSVVQRQAFQRTAVFHPCQFVRVRHLIQLDIHTADVGVLLLDDDLGVTGRDLTAVKPKRDEKAPSVTKQLLTALL